MTTLRQPLCSLLSRLATAARLRSFCAAAASRAKVASVASSGTPCPSHERSAAAVSGRIELTSLLSTLRVSTVTIGIRKKTRRNPSSGRVSARFPKSRRRSARRSERRSALPSATAVPCAMAPAPAAMLTTARPSC